MIHRYANPSRFLDLARLALPVCFMVGGALVLVGVWAGLTQTPPDYRQGDTARILYIHVPAAWLAMGGWMALALAGVSELVWRHPLAAIAARAIAVPGMIFAGVCLVTGSLWGKPTWGTWWEWDGRMTSVLLLFFLYAGYVALTRPNGRASRQALPPRGAAIYALLGAVNLPIINRSVVWWNSLHQGPSISWRGVTIDSELLWPLGLTLVGFTMLFMAISLMRMRAFIADNRVIARQHRQMAEDF